MSTRIPSAADLEVHSVPTPDGEGRTFVLRPTLSELLGVAGFGCRDPIILPGTPRPLDGWALFGPIEGRLPAPH